MSEIAFSTLTQPLETLENATYLKIQLCTSLWLDVLEVGTFCTRFAMMILRNNERTWHSSRQAEKLAWVLGWQLLQIRNGRFRKFVVGSRQPLPSQGKALVEPSTVHTAYSLHSTPVITFLVLLADSWANFSFRFQKTPFILISVLFVLTFIYLGEWWTNWDAL